MDAKKITKKQREEAVAPLMFLKEDRNGDIKGNARAEVTKQQKKIKMRTRIHLKLPQSQYYNRGSGHT